MCGLYTGGDQTAVMCVHMFSCVCAWCMGGGQRTMVFVHMCSCVCVCVCGGQRTTSDVDPHSLALDTDFC